MVKMMTGDAGAEDRDEHGGEGDGREGHHDVEGAHHALVAELARGGGDRSEQCADDEGDGGRAEPDDQGVARAVDDAGEDVASRPVGAEPVVAVGAQHRRAGGERILREQRCEHRGEDDDDQDAEGHPGGEGQGAEGDARP
jgi:hypothetical protein